MACPRRRETSSAGQGEGEECANRHYHLEAYGPLEETDKEGSGAKQDTDVEMEDASSRHQVPESERMRASPRQNPGTPDKRDTDTSEDWEFH